MTQNCTPPNWSAKKAEAAELLAEDRLTDQQIADKIGLKRRQLYNWKNDPVFAQRVTEIAKELDEAVTRRGIGRVINRARALNDRWQRMQAVIEARKGDPENADAPGGDTGLLVRTRKMIGAGEAAREVVEYAVDTGLLKELREHEKQAAQELGQWAREPQQPSGRPTVIIYLPEPDPLPPKTVIAIPEPETNGDG